MGTDVTTSWERKDSEGNWIKFEPPIDKEIYFESRNYSAWALLFDVTNGYGFAGGLTHARVLPYFPSRGFPPGSSCNPDDFEYEWGITWATIKELKQINWDHIFIRMAIVSLEQYEIFKKTGMPEKCFEFVPQNSKIALNDAQLIIGNGYTHILVHWTEQSIKDCSMKRYLDKHFSTNEFDDFRIIFAFDN